MKKLFLYVFLGLLWCNASFAEAVDLSKREVHESKIDIAWKIDNKYLTPNCFVYVSWSGDNYELFFYTYIENP
ncbi:MAG: hypothetical protein QF816_05215 [Candidatus Scalindua sp.]|nr:hypothetical protein [Candidatus Scalindua sp.]